MKANEKQLLIETYSKEFKYLLSIQEMGMVTEVQKALVNGQKSILKLFFTDKEINTIENNIRVSNEYRKDLFLNVESWLKQIEKEQGIKEYLFTWNEEGINKVNRNYNWLFEEYKGLKNAIEMTLTTIQRAA